MTSIDVFKFFANYGLPFALCIGLVPGAIKPKLINTSLLVNALVLSFSLYSIYKVKEYKKAPHYSVGECYAFLDKFGDVKNTNVIFNKTDSSYEYLYYMEDSNKYFPIKYKKKEFFYEYEHTFDLKVNCPKQERE